MQNFLSNFRSLLTVPTVKSSNILAGIYFIFLKECPRANLKSLAIPNLDLSEKIEKVVIM